MTTSSRFSIIILCSWVGNVAEQCC